MKLISKITFTALLFLSIMSLGFETSHGTYVSQQDVIRLLNDILAPESGDSFFDRDFESCAVYQNGNSINNSNSNLYHLGFTNLETGQRLMQEPGSSYVLHLDVCIEKLVKKALETSWEKLLGDDYHLDLATWMSKKRTELMQQNKLEAPYTTPNGQSSTWSSILIMRGRFFADVQAQHLPESLREKVIESAFLRSFRSQDLIPKEHYDQSKKELLDEALKPSNSLLDLIQSSYKRAIINDYLLKY